MSASSEGQLYGYAGKLLRVDVSNEKVKVDAPDPEMLRAYIGGIGVGAKTLYDELPAGIDPLGPENKLIFTTGPLTGTEAPGSGFVEVCFKSPLTGVWGESKCGSDWGGNLRKAGFDFLVVEGKARTPRYIVINDGEVEIRPAEKLQGKTTREKTKLVLEELKDDRYKVAVIGPAGEKLVRFANIMIEDRAAGRCGAGAVMASKNLLAIAVKGNGKIPVANPREFSGRLRQ